MHCFLLITKKKVCVISYFYQCEYMGGHFRVSFIPAVGCLDGQFIPVWLFLWSLVSPDIISTWWVLISGASSFSDT